MVRTVQNRSGGRSIAAESFVCDHRRREEKRQEQRHEQEQEQEQRQEQQRHDERHDERQDERHDDENVVCTAVCMRQQRCRDDVDGGFCEYGDDDERGDDDEYDDDEYDDASIVVPTVARWNDTSRHDDATPTMAPATTTATTSSLAIFRALCMVIGLAATGTLLSTGSILTKGEELRRRREGGARHVSKIRLRGGVGDSVSSVVVRPASYVDSLAAEKRASVEGGAQQVPPPPPFLSSPTTTTATSPPRAFVCITGQLPRLELQNKIDNLFVPFHTQYGVLIDVALVLSDTDNKSVNRKNERAQLYHSVDAAADVLSSVPGVTVLNRNIDVQSADPIVNEQYLEQRGEGSSMSPGQMHQRVQNHIRQFESLARCEYYLSNSHTRQYDIVHRIREDSGYYSPVDFDTVLALTRQWTKTIVPPGGCDVHGGINDRGAFASPDAAYDYFVTPVLHMYLRPLPASVRNTEQFLDITYKRTCHVESSRAYHIFRIWNKEDGTTEFSPSDVKCIEKFNLDKDKYEHGGDDEGNNNEGE